MHVLVGIRHELGPIHHMNTVIAVLVKDAENNFFRFFREGLFGNHFIDVFVCFFLQLMGLLEENQVVVFAEEIRIFLMVVEVRGGHFDFLLRRDPCMFYVFFKSAWNLGRFEHFQKLFIGKEAAVGVVEEVSGHIEQTDEIGHR